MSIFGSLMSANSQIKAGNAAGDAHDFNASIAEGNADQAIIQAAQQERQQRIIGRKAVGDMRASFGASGGTGGSAMDVLAESMANAEMDALNIRYAGEVKSANFKNEANLMRLQGRNARNAAQSNANATIFNGMTSTFMQFAAL